MTISFAYNHLWDFEWAQLDALLADIDLEDLPLDTRDGYQDLVLHRRFITGEPAAAEVELEQLHERRTATGDAQVELGVELDRAGVAFMNGRFEETFERAIRTDDPLPASPSVAWALIAALQLLDRASLQRVLELIEARPFRGRAIDMLRDAATAGVAALEGRDGEAERLFEVACAAAVEVFPKTFAYMVVAGAAGLLGLDHPLGRQLGRNAYDAYAAGGATTLLEVLSDCLVPPESGERASTA